MSFFGAIHFDEISPPFEFFHHHVGLFSDVLITILTFIIYLLLHVTRFMPTFLMSFKSNFCLKKPLRNV